VNYCIQNGFANFSLRGLANEIGTSHRMLIYHFGSVDGLFRSILEEFRLHQVARFVREFDAVESVPEFKAALISLWRHLASDENRNFMISYLEIQIAAIRRGENRRGSTYLAATLEVWLDPIFKTFVRLGFSANDGRRLARLILSGGRGLILDALGAGDRAERREILQTFAKLADLVPPPSQR